MDHSTPTAPGASRPLMQLAAAAAADRADADHPAAPKTTQQPLPLTPPPPAPEQTATGLAGSAAPQTLVEKPPPAAFVDLDETGVGPSDGIDDPPDGGARAWLVVFASFVVHFVVLGIMYSFGVFQSYFVSENLASSSVVSFIGTVGAALLPAFGIVSGRLAERFGFRRMIFIGTLILFLGLILASFSSKVWHLFLTQGVLFGLGASIIYFPAVSVPPQYFSKRRGLATGTAVAGSGIGGLVVALVTTKMLDALGFQWTMRITAIFALVSLLAVNPLLESRIPPAPNSKADFTIFKDIRFFLLVGTDFCLTFAQLVPIYFLPQFAEERLGLPLATGSAVLSVYNGSSALGRVLLGLGADGLLGSLNSLMLCTFFSAASLFGLWNTAGSLPVLVLFAIVNGFVGGGFISLFPVTLASIFGVRRLPSVVGTLYSLSSIGNLVGAPLAAYIKDTSGGFAATIYYAGGVTLVASALVLVVRLLEDRNLFKRM